MPDWIVIPNFRINLPGRTAKFIAHFPVRGKDFPKQRLSGASREPTSENLYHGRNWEGVMNIGLSTGKIQSCSTSSTRRLLCSALMKSSKRELFPSWESKLPGCGSLPMIWTPCLRKSSISRILSIIRARFSAQPLWLLDLGFDQDLRPLVADFLEAFGVISHLPSDRTSLRDLLIWSQS